MCFLSIHGKNNLDDNLSKNLVRKRDTNLKIILMEYQNNYAERSSIMSNAAKNFDILAVAYIITLMVQQNYFQICIQLNF